MSMEIVVERYAGSVFLTGKLENLCVVRATETGFRHVDGIPPFESE